ncbi:MAG: permease-like cell division protein FtsX [Bacteroidales bacterium]|jgi:cell division transport system permease protein|nr:permease-like cell division protein FtsX [Bacteroidales bacterium]
MNKYPDSIDKITIARLRFSAIGSVVSIALSVFFVGTLCYLAFFSYNFINDFSKKIELEILFYSEVREADVVAMEQTLKLEKYISASRVSSRAENTETAKKLIGNNYTDLISNPINASIIFSIHPDWANSDSLNAISKTIKRNPSVQDVQYPDFLVKEIDNKFMTIQIVILGFCGLFMIISLLLISNFIRLNIYAQRHNIKSMLLVGASRSFIRKPFLRKGFIQGVWGGFIAVLLMAAMLYEGNLIFPEFVDFTKILYISIILLALFFFSILYTVLTSLVAVNKYIKMNNDLIHL